VKEKEIILQILGMHCAACATSIESGLKRLDGIIAVNVNFASKEAIVKFDEDKVTLDKIKATIKRGGYEAVERVEDVSEKRKKEVRRRLLLFAFGLVLTIPIVFITYFTMFSWKNYVLLALATPVQFIVGWHFYRGA
jgi:Cu+-exporting ATPase